MRTLIATVLLGSVAYAASPLDDLDATRVTALNAETAAAQLKPWAAAIARAERDAKHREVVELEKALYGVAYKGYLATVACKTPDVAACTTAIDAITPAQEALEARFEPSRLWSSYRQTYGTLVVNLRLLATQLRQLQASAGREARWNEAVATFNAAVAERTKALAAVGPEADEARLRAALTAAQAAEEACGALKALPHTRDYPVGCRASDARGVQLGPIKNRLPAGPDASNAAACSRSCPAPLGEAVVVADFAWGAVDGHVRVRELFEAVHPSRFRFLARDVREDREVVAQRGELVLLTTSEARGAGAVSVVTLDNRHVSVPAAFLSATRIKGARLLASKPEDFVVLGKDASGKTIQLGNAWDSFVDDSAPEGEPAFLTAMDVNSKDYERFVRQSDAFLDCFEKTMKRLDPDGTAWRYDRETYNVRTGNTVKIENYGEALRRQACTSCGCRKYNAARAALASKVLAPLRKIEAATYAAVVARLEAKLAP